ncbi:MAG: murein biosynthesis integral membrane protein MurJ [Kiritimatiellae bacterium]|nr:murein biosynthesis integral membrane protein MurJ [Kiritimatiellia bacterium]
MKSKEIVDAKKKSVKFRNFHSSLLKHVFTVGSFTALSRVLGLVREMLQSRLIGAGVEQSAFALAFALPNMARKLFGEGALTAAFVPVFRREVKQEGIEKAARLARAVITMMLLMVGAVLALAFLVLFCSAAFFEGAVEDLFRFRITVRLVAILLPYMLMICGAAFGMGVLNALGRFKASSFMPALLNVVWIAALAVLMLFTDLPPRTSILFVAGAILVGGFLQMAFMFRCMAKVGVRPVPLFAGWRGEKVRLVWRNTVIAAMGAGAVQVNYMLDQVLAQRAAPWAAGVIGYAERLMDLPLGVVGVAFGTVLLPTFSGHFAKGDVEGAKACLRKSVLQMLAVMIPASVVTFFCAPWIVWLVYEGHAFDPTATVRVARALSVYGLGLCFFSIQKCLIPFFQAQGDMATPLRVSVATVVLNAALNVLAVVLLPQEWRHVGLAASTSFCALAACILFIRTPSFRLLFKRKM